MRIALGHGPGSATPLNVRQVTPLNSHPAALPGRLHQLMRSAPVSPRAFTSARMHAGSCESSVPRADRNVFDRSSPAERVSLMRVIVALERATALMVALTYASVQKDVLLVLLLFFRTR